MRQLETLGRDGASIDFLLLDHVGHEALHSISDLLDKYPSLVNTKAIHLYTPTGAIPTRIIGHRETSQENISSTQAANDVDMALAATGFSSKKRTAFQGGLEAPAYEGRILRVNKPPRRARILQLLATLREIPTSTSGITTSQITQALESLNTAKALFKSLNVLIAEGKLFSFTHDMYLTRPSVR